MATPAEIATTVNQDAQAAPSGSDDARQTPLTLGREIIGSRCGWNVATGNSGHRWAVNVNPEPATLPLLLATVAKHLGGARIVSVADDPRLKEAVAGGLPIETAPTVDAAFRKSEAFDEVAFILPAWGRYQGAAKDRWTPDVVPTKPFGAIFPAAELQSRVSNRLAELGEPILVIEGGSLGPAMHMSIRTALVVIDPRPTAGSLVTKFFRVPEAADAQTVMAELADLLTRKGGRTANGNGYVLRSNSLSRQSLRYEDHDPRVTAQEDDLAEFGEGGTVGDVFEVVMPRPGAGRPGSESDELDSAIRLLRGRDVSLAGEILSEDPDAGEGRPQPRIGVALRAGDLVLRSIESPNRNGIPVEIKKDDLPMAAGTNLVVLRPKRPLKREELDFYRLYLGSARSRVVMRPSQMGGHLRLTDIKNCPLPVPDADLVDALGDIRRAQRLLSEWADQGLGLTSRAFEGPASDARRALIETGRQLRQRVEAAAQVGSLDHRIANFYPYPIAHKWRLVRVAESAADDSKTYESVLACFEATMAFSASLALTCAYVNEVEVGPMREVRKKLTRGAGAGIGDWVNILKFVSSSKPFKQLSADAPLVAIRGLLPEGSDVARAQERLSERRNDESHQRKVDELDLASALREARADLETILEAAGFLADLPIYQVRSTRWDSIEGQGEAVVEVLRGDHPVPSSATVTHTQTDLEKDSLYVRDLSGDLILLRPFLIRLECPSCRSWSTFHPDRRREGRLLLKAVDHAHTVDGSQFEAVLARVGYLEGSTVSPGT